MSTSSETMLVRVEAVTFRNGSATLAGTLLLPPHQQQHQHQPPYAGVVLVHGSGDDTRDGYRVYAQYFAEHGIAALIYDKRGVGASTGNWRAGTFTELAGDALAGLQLLVAHDEIDAQRVGLWGCSEGGWVVPLAASQSPQVRFLIAVSPPGMSPALQEQYRRTLLIKEVSGSRLRRAWRMTAMRLMFATLRHAPRQLLPGLAGYFARTMEFDPLPSWRTITQPTLLVFGAEDKAVPPRQSAMMIEAALRAAGNPAYTIRIFPGGDHGIQHRDAETHTRLLVPGYLDALADWMVAQ